MKSRLIILAVLGSLTFVSCKKQPCPAYGKVNQKIEKTSVNS